MIGFAIKNLKLSKKSAYSMGWAEFVLRSQGYKEDLEYQQRLFRRVAYETFSIKGMFSKKSLPSMQKFWKIGEEEEKSVPKAFLEAMKAARQNFKDKLNG